VKLRPLDFASQRSAPLSQNLRSSCLSHTTRAAT